MARTLYRVRLTFRSFLLLFLPQFPMCQLCTNNKIAAAAFLLRTVSAYPEVVGSQTLDGGPAVVGGLAAILDAGRPSDGQVEMSTQARGEMADAMLVFLQQRTPAELTDAVHLVHGLGATMSCMRSSLVAVLRSIHAVAPDTLPDEIRRRFDEEDADAARVQRLRDSGLPDELIELFVNNGVVVDIVADVVAADRPEVAG